MKRTASAAWQGGFKEGKGSITTESGALSAYPYGVASRFGDQPGTNPEELLGAAHAGCFAMAFSLILGEAGFTPEQLDVTAEVSLEKQGDGFAVTRSHLILRARIPRLDETKFSELSEAAKKGCPLSKAINAEITLDAALV